MLYTNFVNVYFCKIYFCSIMLFVLFLIFLCMVFLLILYVNSFSFFYYLCILFSRENVILHRVMKIFFRLQFCICIFLFCLSKYYTIFYTIFCVFSIGKSEIFIEKRKFFWFFPPIWFGEAAPRQIFFGRGWQTERMLIS